MTCSVLRSTDHVAVLAVVFLSGLVCAQDDPPVKPRRPKPSPVEAAEAAIRNALNLPPAKPELPPKTTEPEPDPEPDPSPAPVVPRASRPAELDVPFTLEQAAGIEGIAQQCRTAAEAVALYQLVIANPQLAPEGRATALAKLDAWQKQAARGQTRVGKKWISRAEAEDLFGQAEALEKAALGVLEKDRDDARARLDKALRLVPDRLETLFLLALVDYRRTEFATAERRLTQLLARVPDHPPVLNNAGIAAAKSGKLVLGLKHLARAAALRPGDQTIVHNLGLAIAEARAKKADKRVVDPAHQVYQQILSTAKGAVKKADETRSYALDTAFRKKDETVDEENPYVGFASGVVVAPGFVLTALRPVDDGLSLAVLEPTSSPEAPLAASVAAQPDGVPVALIECQGLQAAPALLSPVAPEPKTTALMATVERLKDEPAARSLRIAAAASDQTEQLVPLSGTVRLPEAGAPLFDPTARVLGLALPRSFTDRPLFAEGLAVPASAVLPFLEKSVPDFPGPADPGPRLSDNDAALRLARSTVRILIQKKPFASKPAEKR